MQGSQVDVFIEVIVKRHKTTRDKLLIALFFLLFLVVIFLTLVFIEYVLFFIWMLWLGAGYGLYFLITQLDIEYEYICTNGHLDIDQITHRRKRKRMISIAAKEMEILAPVKSDDYKEHSRNQNLKALHLETNTGDEKVWFFTGHYKGTNYLVTFEPNERILRDLKRHNPSKVKYQLTRLD